MKWIPAILFSICLCLAGQAQRTIRGRVVNAATGTAVPGSSVFITNTSKGTVSDNGGIFILNDIPPGKHELVISSVGYETNVFAFSEDQLPLQLKIELTIKVKELENVYVEPSVEEGWDRWGKVFLENFVGTSASASQCRIKNEKSIRFRYYKKSKRLIAYCDEPVLLENKALGYNISYQLENFEINYNDRSFSYLGYSLFEPIVNSGRGKLQRWDKNREEAYAGSVMHFMRSLYSNRLLSEGFEVRRLRRIPNLEKERVKKIYRPARIVRTMQSTGVVIETKYDTVGYNRDSTAYYDSVLHQPDFTDIYGRQLLTADSLLAGSQGEYRIIRFDDYLYITYNNEKEENGYAAAQIPARKPGYQHSTVTLLNEKQVVIEKNGSYYDPRNFFTSGYWGWSEKMANSLPLDYEPVRATIK